MLTKEQLNDFISFAIKLLEYVPSRTPTRVDDELLVTLNLFLTDRKAAVAKLKDPKFPALVDAFRAIGPTMNELNRRAFGDALANQFFDWVRFMPNDSDA